MPLSVEERIEKGGVAPPSRSLRPDSPSSTVSDLITCLGSGRPQRNERNYWACPAGTKKDGIEVPSFRRECVEPGGSEGTTSITHPDASLRVSFTNCQKKGSSPQTTPCSTYSKKVFRGLPRQQVVKNTQITAIGRANHSGAICPAVQGGRQKKGEVPPPPPNSTHCPLTG